MASLFAALRPIVTVSLGIVVSLGSFLFVVESTVSGKLLDDEFYAGVLEEQDAYNRLYDDVLQDDQVWEFLEENLPYARDIATHDEVIGIAEYILTRASLQRHVERLLSQAARYLNGDSKKLELYVDLTRELEHVEPVLLAFVEERIDRVPARIQGVPDCSPVRVAHLAEEFADRANMLQRGRIPDSLPSLEPLSPRCRELIYAATHEGLVRSSRSDGRVVDGLMDQSGEIRAAFVQGDTHAAVKSVVIPIVTPAIHDAVAAVREELDERDRLQLLDRLARHSGEDTAEDLRDGMADLRRWVIRGTGLARNLGWPLLLGGSVLLVLVHIPRFSTGLRWLGVTAIIAGGSGLIVSKIIQSILPNRASFLVDSVTDGVSDFPVSLTELISDIAVSIISQLAEGAAGMSLIALAVGVALFAGSFLTWSIRRLQPPGL